jgi:hypothetical protein
MTPPSTSAEFAGTSLRIKSMARARNIKPGFFSNDELVELSFATRLLFIGLWTLADRSGRMEDRPKKIKMALFPADDLDIDGALNELQASGFIHRYEVESVRYIQVIEFAKHQNPHRDEKASSIPAPLQHSASTVQAPDNNGANRADSPIPNSPIPDTGFPEVPAAKNCGDGYPPEFEQAWDAYPSRPGASKKESQKAWAARLKTGVKPEVILAGVERYAKFVLLSRTEPQFIKQPATFFGPGEHYTSDWTVAQSRAGPTYQTANDKAKILADRLTGKTRNEPSHDLIDINERPA